jgi:hypothetical protein
MVGMFVLETFKYEGVRIIRKSDVSAEEARLQKY